MVHVIFWQAGLISEQRPFLVKLMTYNPLSLPPHNPLSTAAWHEICAHFVYVIAFPCHPTPTTPPFFMMNVCGPLAK